MWFVMVGCTADDSLVQTDTDSLFNEGPSVLKLKLTAKVYGAELC